MFVIIFVLAIIAGVVNILSYFMTDGFSLFRRGVVWMGLKKSIQYKLLQHDLVISGTDGILWEKTEFGDFQIRVILANKIQRTSTRYEIIVDKGGKVLLDLDRNRPFVDRLGLKD